MSKKKPVTDLIYFSQLVSIQQQIMMEWKEEAIKELRTAEEPWTRGYESAKANTADAAVSMFETLKGSIEMFITKAVYVERQPSERIKSNG